jgi:hypothetical protein
MCHLLYATCHLMLTAFSITVIVASAAAAVQIFFCFYYNTCPDRILMCIVPFTFKKCLRFYQCFGLWHQRCLLSVLRLTLAEQVEERADYGIRDAFCLYFDLPLRNKLKSGRIMASEMPFICTSTCPCGTS